MKKPWKVLSWNYPKIRINGWCFYCWPWLERNPIAAYSRAGDCWDFELCMGGFQIRYNNYDDWGAT